MPLEDLEDIGHYQLVGVYQGAVSSGPSLSIGLFLGVLLHCGRIIIFEKNPKIRIECMSSIK